MSDDLFTAAEQNNTKRLEELLADGADVNEQDWDRGNTPIHWAAARGNLDAIEVLLEYGADINIQNKHGRTPLHVLVSERFDKIVLWLVQYCNADPYIPDKRGVTAFDLAQRFFQPEIERAIENRGQAVGTLTFSFHIGERLANAAEESDEEDESEEQDLESQILQDSTEVPLEIIRIYSRSGSYKSIPINQYTTADQAISILLKKLDWPESFHRHLDLYELVTKVVANKRYKKESKIEAMDLLFDVRQKWPVTLTEAGAVHENCHFILGVKPTAPTKVHVLYSQM